MNKQQALVLSWLAGSCASAVALPASRSGWAGAYTERQWPGTSISI